MRRILLAILCCLMLVTAVSAASTVSDLQNNTTVHSDGTCQVVLTVQLQLEEVPGKLTFPLPAEARNITLNGSRARVNASGNVRNVDLSSAIRAPGNYTFIINYEMPDSVTQQKNGKLLLTVQLLSGFSYPIENMSFTIQFPGKIETIPEFTSTYLQEAVDSIMDYRIEESTITCAFTSRLKDHESLTMTIGVSSKLFPQPISKQWRLSTDDIAMYTCALLALAYWLLTMRCLPPRRTRQADVPQGISAGELGCCLTAQGVDFSMMILSWAQMGYLLIQPDDNGRVLLHRNMEMGNERSEFEVRTFRALFGKRRTIDATGYHFTRIAEKTSRNHPGVYRYFQPHSGNPQIFRLLCAAMGFFAGICFTVSFAADTLWQILLGIVLVPLCTFLCWQIQSGAGVLHLRQKKRLYLALCYSAMLLVLSLLASELSVGILLLFCQWLGGLGAFYGGRRSDNGKELMSSILGLRHHLTSVSREALYQTLRANPEYYYNIAPYALALGVDRPLARQMGERKLPPCSYLTTGLDGHLTATEWNALLRSTIAALDEPQQKPFLEYILGK